VCREKGRGKRGSGRDERGMWERKGDKRREENEGMEGKGRHKMEAKEHTCSFRRP